MTMPHIEKSAITAAFPIPACNQLPEDEMIRAISLLSMVQQLLNDLPPRTTAISGLVSIGDIDMLIGLALDMMRPIQRYLENDDRGGTLEAYRQARRGELMDIFKLAGNQVDGGRA